MIQPPIRTRTRLCIIYIYVCILCVCVCYRKVTVVVGCSRAVSIINSTTSGSVFIGCSRVPLPRELTDRSAAMRLDTLRIQTPYTHSVTLYIILIIQRGACKDI